MAGDQDDGQGGIQRLQAAQQLAAVHSGHAQVGDDHAGEIGVDLGQSRLGGAEGVNRQIVEL
ncbi:hypothetical protein D3C87_1629400 [compost metagenome]